MYSHELARYVQLGRRTVPVHEGKPELVLQPIRIEIRDARGVIHSVHATAFLTRDGELVLQGAM